MTCPSCAHANSNAARFCNGCGAALVLHCQGCGTDNPPGARFCNGCGASLAARPAAAEARFVAGEAASTGGQAPILALHRAFARHDWKTLRECVDPDAVVCDHRPLGLDLSTGDDWLESLRVLADLAPDVDAWTFHILAWNRHGRVDVSRVGGTMPEGGGPFENIVVRTIATAGDRLQRCELFDVGDVDRALVRFEDLCSHLACIPSAA